MAGPDWVVLPQPFTVALVDGKATPEVRPGCWAVSEHVPTGIVRHVTVPHDHKARSP
ncbi:hypothetical protein ACQE3C_02785 [Propionibacteriaceae bacterium Y1814]